MPFKEIFLLAFSALSANKLRSGLTMLGITIGVFSVISVMTATGALQGSVETGLSFLGSNIFQFSKYPAISGGGPQARDKYANRKNVTYEQALRYVHLMEDTGAVISLKVFNDNKQITYGRLRTNPNIQICGTNPYFIVSNNYRIADGRNFNDADVALSRNVTIIGRDIRTRIFPVESPIGKTIKISDKNFVVIGTLAEKGSAFGNSEDNLVLVPITRYFEDYGHVGRTVNIATQASSQENYERTFNTAVGAMRMARALKPGEENDFEIFTNDSLVAAFASVADVIRAGAFVISSIALVAAGVGIMNIMLVSVTERTKEIGIRKSIGAKKGDILRQFLVEAVALSVLGGLVGILLGVLGGDGLAAMLEANVFFPWGWAIAGLAVCSGIGIGFGLYPAWRAASLDPIEALRFE